MDGQVTRLDLSLRLRSVCMCQPHGWYREPGFVKFEMTFIKVMGACQPHGRHGEPALPVTGFDYLTAHAQFACAGHMVPVVSLVTQNGT